MKSEFKLPSFKKWFTLSEASKYISDFIGENFNEADLLQCVLDGKLTISLNFVNYIYASEVYILNSGEEGYENGGEWGYINSRQKYFHKDDYSQTVSGIYDLLLLGSGFRLVNQSYHRIANGPEVIIQHGGIFLRCPKTEKIYALIEGDYNDFPPPFISEDTEVKSSLPDDCYFVVRKEQLNNFSESFQDFQKKEELDPRSETTYLNIIGALLEYIRGESPGIGRHPNYSSQAQLIEHLNDFGIYGLKKTTLETKFAAAKRSFESE